MHFVGHYSSIL